MRIKGEAEEDQNLKPEGMGLIVRTARGWKRGLEDDLSFLLKHGKT